jgi:hypothetical protein
MIRKVALSTLLLAFAIYIFLPTPDELFIYPAVGLFLTYTFHISLVYAVLMITLFYYGSGVVALLAALTIGGKPIYNNLKQIYRKSRVQPLFKRWRAV